MTRKQTLWLGSALWGAAFAVSGAFAFAMQQPLVHHYDYSPTSIVRPEQNESIVRTPSTTTEPLTFAALEITVPRATVSHSEALPKAKPAPAQRDIQQMNCSDWRPLEQGGNAVRECQ
ncbi:MAG: hypothetical protein ABI183_08990 [Polyangiaceae bacterium]